MDNIELHNEVMFYKKPWSVWVTNCKESGNYIHEKSFGHDTCMRCRGAESIKYSFPMGRQMGK